MRSVLIVSLVLADPTVSAVRAQNRPFPYEALVDTDEALVRSGPGRTYYPTGKLRQGDRVLVHRHDPGGWYMIAPPPGSFSWIRADYVKPSPLTPLPPGEGSGVRGRGVLTANNVVVRVGSALGDQRDVEQKRLSTGEEVEILGEKTFQTERGPLRMYKIKPPQGEYRWVQGQFVVPVDHDDNIIHIQPPKSRLKTPATRSPSSSEEQVSPRKELPSPSVGDAPEHDRQLDSGDGAVLHRGPSAEQIEADRKRLAELDARFRSVITRETDEWDFSQLQQDYRTLQDEASHPALAGQIDLRLATLERYQTIKREYDEFIQIAEETSRREAHLASLQQQQQSLSRQPTQRQPQLHDDSSAGSSTVIPRPAVPRSPVRSPHARTRPGIPSNGPQLVPPQTMPAPIPNRQPPHAQYSPGQRPSGQVQLPAPSLRRRSPWWHALRTGPGRLGHPVPGPAHPQRATPQRRPAASPRPFDGVGIVQRAALTVPGAPQHVLIARNGRILAYLQPGPRLSLDRYLGQPIRVAGPRLHHRELKTDVIVVRTLTPVAFSSQ